MIAAFGETAPSRLGKRQRSFGLDPGMKHDPRPNRLGIFLRRSGRLPTTLENGPSKRGAENRIGFFPSLRRARSARFGFTPHRRRRKPPGRLFRAPTRKDRLRKGNDSNCAVRIKKICAPSSPRRRRLSSLAFEPGNFSPKSRPPSQTKKGKARNPSAAV